VQSYHTGNFGLNLITLVYSLQSVPWDVVVYLFFIFAGHYSLNHELDTALLLDEAQKKQQEKKKIC
jgi:hypothetical protein